MAIIDEDAAAHNEASDRRQWRVQGHCLQYSSDLVVERCMACALREASQAEALSIACKSHFA